MTELDNSVHACKDPAVEKPRIGIIQSRGLGDLFIALPIARHYWLQGNDIVWPICEEFLATMTACAPWVRWIPVGTDPRGEFFWDRPMRVFKYNDVSEDRIINLYQYLSNRPQDSDPDIFPILKFDQYKYAVSGVPFKQKWTLGEFLVRDQAEEDRVYSAVVDPSAQGYIVVHTQGSDRVVHLDLSEAEAQGYQVITIREGVTENATAWLRVIEGAEALYLIDSCFSNLVDQLDISVDKTFIRRSKMDLTPVLGSQWTYMSP